MAGQRVLFNNDKRLVALLSDNRAALLRVRAAQADGRDRINPRAPWPAAKPERTAPMRFTLANLRRSMTSTLAAAAVAVTGMTAMPTPAAANDDLIKFLLGATALAIVVQGVRSGNAQVHIPQVSAPRTLPAECRETLQVRNRHVSVYNAHCLQNAHVRNLPAQCHEVVRTNHGNRGIYRERCLQESGWRVGGGGHHGPVVTPPRHEGARALPQECAIRYRVRGGIAQGYDAGCLSNAGLRRLPQSCEARRYDGQVFDAQCLIDAGFRRR